MSVLGKFCLHSFHFTANSDVIFYVVQKGTIENGGVKLC